MKVDVYTPIKETAKNIARIFYKRFDNRNEDDTMEPIIYHVFNIDYESLKPLLSEFILEVRESKTGEIIWPKLSKRALEKRLGL